MKRSIVAAVALALTLAGCGAKVTEPFKDAPTSSQRNSGTAQVVEFPDGFSNLAGKCDGPNYIYSGYHGDGNRMAIAVVPNDPRCRG